MPEKRPHGGSGGGGDSKRPRSNNASPAPTTDISSIVAQARARAEAARARQGLPKSGANTPIPNSASPAVQPPAELARARAAALSQRAAATVSGDSNSKLAAVERARAVAEELSRKRAAEAAEKSSRGSASKRHDESFAQYRARMNGGLNVGLHPALTGQDKQEQKSEPSRQPEKSRSRRRDYSPVPRDEKKVNPYIGEAVEGEEVVSSRPARPLVFHEHGKFINEAAKQRRKAQLEEMKSVLAQRDNQTDDLGPEKAYLIDQPPELEWWDESLINGSDYENLDAPGKIILDGDDSPVTIYILHPIQIEAPQDKLASAPKPMYLTKDETRKLRRQRRKADLKEEQAKIRLGLVEPPPPKVKIGNLMRVLGDSAVKDPTAVEAQVRKGIADRLAQHEAANAGRALTSDERGEKLIKRQEGDVAKGTYINVYRIGNLSYGKHRYQIDVNARQEHLTGICVMNPEMNVLVVEGGSHALRNYRKLLQRRIKWHENVYQPRRREPAEGDNGDEPEFEEPDTTSFLSQFEADGNLKNLSENGCWLVWEGETKQPAFKQWRGMKACETEQRAKDVLGKVKMENMWALAKSFDTSEKQVLWTFDAAKAAKVLAEDEEQHLPVPDF